MVSMQEEYKEIIMLVVGIPTTPKDYHQNINVIIPPMHLKTSTTKETTSTREPPSF